MDICFLFTFDYKNWDMFPYIIYQEKTAEELRKSGFNEWNFSNGYQM